jgi:esterase/lipase superfamily enzyme
MWLTRGGQAVLLQVAVALAANPVSAQPAFAPERCSTAQGQSLTSLEARRQALESEIAALTRPAAPPAKSPAPGAASKKDERKLRDSKEQLLEVLFRIDCLTPAALPAASKVERRARAITPRSPIEVTTYYATTRRATGSSAPEGFFGEQAASTIQFGRAVVSIPPGHTPGNLELPTLWRFERNADPSRHFVLRAVQPLVVDAARNELTEKLQGMPSHALLLFVHGYNTSFADAALRTAQLAHDLAFPGLALFYSWPSAGRALAYWQDEEASEIAEGPFEELLVELSRLPVRDIYIVAHSMGNRIVTTALRNRVDRKDDNGQIRALLLAAPDINADLFRSTIAPKLAAMQGTQTTIYAASSDLALRASKIVHGFKRVGETIGGIFIYPGIDTIDASRAANIIHDFGHSYLMDSSPVLTDIKSIVLEKLAARERGLSEMGTSPNLYWQLR